MKAKCECKFNDLLNNQLLGNNMWYKYQMEEITQILSGTNLIILKCIKEFFKYKYCINHFGSYIIIGITFIKIILTIIFCPKSIYKAKKYIFILAEKYSQYLNAQKNINSPNKKAKRNSDKCMYQKSSDILIKVINKNEEGNIKSVLNNNNKQSNTNNYLFLEKMKFSEDSIKTNSFNSNNKKIFIDTKTAQKMEEYMKTDFDELVYEEALIKDNRKFFEYFIHKIKANFIIFDIFCNKTKLKPTEIKIILLLINLEFYLFINALFFNEELISEIYNSKNENKYSFISRTFNRIFQIIIVIITYNNLIECFFVNENKIKDIMIKAINLLIAFFNN